MSSVKILKNVGMIALTTTVAWLSLETVAAGVALSYKYKAREHYNIAAANPIDYIKTKQEQDLAEKCNELGDKWLSIKEKYGLTPKIKKLIKPENAYLGQL